jgi:hypothetical protein
MGPEGSGRFWTITVGVSEQSGSRPSHGACMLTSTVGWRNLQRYSKGPLPWADDVDHDGRAEFILWDSFPLRDGASMAEFGLVAWIYHVADSGSLVLDWDLSARFARRLAEEYRSTLTGSDAIVNGNRARAAQALEEFADRRCGEER